MYQLQSVVVTIADACPTCNNGNSIDLSVAAFKHIATLDEGLVDSTSFIPTQSSIKHKVNAPISLLVLPVGRSRDRLSINHFPFFA